MFKPLHASRLMLTVVASTALLVGVVAAPSSTAITASIDPVTEPSYCAIVWVNGHPVCDYLTAGGL